MTERIGVRFYLRVFDMMGLVGYFGLFGGLDGLAVDNFIHFNDIFI